MPPRAAWWAITVDCNDPRRVAEFWAALFDCAVTEPGPDRPGWLRLQPLGADGPFMNFQPVDEPRLGKVRIHMDVLVDDPEPPPSNGSSSSVAPTPARGRSCLAAGSR